MYRSYSCSNMPEPVRTRVPERQSGRTPQKKDYRDAQPAKQSKQRSSALSKLQNDDIILIIIVAILLINGCEDKLLIIALAYIFLSGYGDNSSITELLQ